MYWFIGHYGYVASILALIPLSIMFGIWWVVVKTGFTIRRTDDVGIQTDLSVSDMTNWPHVPIIFEPAVAISDASLGDFSRLGYFTSALIVEYFDNFDVLRFITTSRSWSYYAREVNEVAITVVLAYVDTIRQREREEQDLSYGMRNMRRAWDSEASSSDW